MQVIDSNQEQIERQALVFSAFADPTRLKLVKILCRQQHPDALCVNALAHLLEVTQPAVSQHLRMLKTIGLVKAERRGYHIHYFINLAALERCRELASMAMSTTMPVNEESCQEHCPERRK